jgi:hypothetical protein
MLSTGRPCRRPCKLGSKSRLGEGAFRLDGVFLPTLRLPSKEGARGFCEEPVSTTLGTGLGLLLVEDSFPRASAIFLRSKTASSFRTRRFHAVSFATLDIPRTVSFENIRPESRLDSLRPTFWRMGVLNLRSLFSSVALTGIKSCTAATPMSFFGWQCFRTFAVGKRGRPTIRATIVKDKESKERRRQHFKEAKARNATDMDRHVLQAYRVLIHRCFRLVAQ